MAQGDDQRSKPEVLAVQHLLGLQVESTSAIAKPNPDVVFVCVDIEAHEEDQNKILEIGVSVADTRDLKGIPPGYGWLTKIKHAHFLIAEYALIFNHKFVKSDPDEFNFGTSTWIRLGDIQQLFGRIFLDPASLDRVADFSQNLEDKGRSVVFVGHNIKAERKYLKSAGVDLNTISPNISRIVDTDILVTSKKNHISLGRLALSVGLQPTGLHNAGNDAALTLQALLLAAIQEHAGIRLSEVAKNIKIDKSAPVQRKELAVSSSQHSRCLGGTVPRPVARIKNAMQLTVDEEVTLGAILQSFQALRGNPQRSHARLERARNIVRELGAVALENPVPPQTVLDRPRMEERARERVARRKLWAEEKQQALTRGNDSDSNGNRQRPAAPDSVRLNSRGKRPRRHANTTGEAE